MPGEVDSYRKNTKAVVFVQCIVCGKSVNGPVTISRGCANVSGGQLARNV